MVAQVKINCLFVAILLIASVCLVESKRGFSIGRSRKKVSNPNVRRKTQGETNVQPSAQDHSSTNQRPIGWNTDSKPAQPVGPPPAYPGLGHNSAPSHGAPPAYSPSHVNPPSYSAATGNSYSNIGKIPPRGTPNQGFPDGTSFHGIGYGHNAYGGPSHTSGLYTNNGMGNGGFSGLGTYGSGYSYGGQGSSPFSFGNILTGLAVWNIARGFNSYNRPQHVFIHDNREVSNQQPLPPSVDESNSTQLPQQILEPVVSAGETSESSTELPIELPLTEVPTDYVTYHPSLLTYAREIGYQPDSFHYYKENIEKIATEDSNIPKPTTSYEEISTEN